MRLSRSERTKRSSLGRQVRRSLRRQLVCERLEDRHLLAISVQWFPATGALTIIGSAASDSIAIGHSGVLEPLLTINGSSAISLPAGPTLIPTRSVNSLHVDGRFGDDTLDLSGIDFFGFPQLAIGAIVILGGAGDDTITGSGLADQIHGGPGNDLLQGGRGDDTLFGDDGIDQLFGDAGNDTLHVGRIGRTFVEPPVVLSTAVDSDSGGRPAIRVRFSQEVHVLPTALELRDALGQNIPIGEAAFRYDPTWGTATWTLPAARLPSGLWKLSILDSAVTNERGLSLDGNSDGIAGDPFIANGVWSTAIHQVDSAPKVTSFQPVYDNDNASLLSGVAMSFTGALHSLPRPEDLQLRHQITGQTITAERVEWDDSTQTAQWRFESPVSRVGYYVATLAGRVLETDSPLPTAPTTSASTSDYVHSVYVVPAGDLNWDGYVSEEEAREVLANLGDHTGGWRIGDRDADGTITPWEALTVVENVGLMITRLLPPPEKMSGGLGDDTFLLISPKGEQAIDIDDEDGIDTVDLSAMNHGSGVQGFDLDLPIVTIPGAAPYHTTVVQLLDPQMIDDVIGTNQADSIYGNVLANRLVGNGGDDRLEGRAGSDVLVGGGGNDVLLGHHGDDMLEGGLGNDWYVYDAMTSGADTIQDTDGITDRLDFGAYPDAIHVDLRETQIARAQNHNTLGVLLAAGAIEQVMGTAADDVLYGNDAANWIDGGDGDDLILGFAGDDVLLGGNGKDRLDPGNGQDLSDPGADFDDPEIRDQISQVTSGFTFVEHPQAFNRFAYLAASANGFPPTSADKVRWMLPDISPGNYELFATWFARPNTGATNARFEISSGHSATVNQQVSPNGPRMAGRRWQSLGEITTTDPTPIMVELVTAGANGDVIADAIRLVRVGELPRIDAITDVILSEQDLLVVPLRATYPLGTLGQIEFTLDADVDPGVTISNKQVDAALGIVTATLTWPPSAARESGSFLITVVATDVVIPTHYHDESFWVTFGDPNEPPHLVPKTTQTVAFGQRLETAFTATDSDGPYWELRYSLDPEHPTGASIDPVSGYFSWDTALSAPGSYPVGVIVTDDGNPPLSDRQDWIVNVIDAGTAAHLLVPTSQSTTEDTALTFSSVFGNSIQIAATESSALILGIVAEDGTAQLSNVPGISYLVGGPQPASHLLVKGSPAALQQALNGLMFAPLPNFRGTTSLHVELIDAGNSVRLPELDTKEIPITVVSVVDSPAIPAQMLFFQPNPDLGELDVVGTVVPHDPDPDQLLMYRIIGGNLDNAFSIDAGTGRVIAAGDDVLPAGERVITVEAYYALAPGFTGQGSVTIRRVPNANSSPYAVDDWYDLLEHQTVAGNLVSGDSLGGSADWDVDGDPISLVRAVDSLDREIPIGVPSRLPSGAMLTLYPDGSFLYDASTSQDFNRKYFGQSLDFVRYTIKDSYDFRASAVGNFSIQHVNDIHAVAPQTFSISSGAMNGDIVGPVLVSNAEPLETFSHSLTTPGSPFVINNEGQLLVQNASQLIDGQLYSLQVSVVDSIGTPVSATMTVKVLGNTLPMVPNRHYTTSIDLPTWGNVLSDMAGTGIPFDPDGGMLQVVQIANSGYDMGRSIRLSSGASITVHANGQFHYDPTTSLGLRDLAATDTHTERIPIAVRDSDGGLVSALLTIVVWARNWKPQAFDNVYWLNNDEELTGNVIDDYGVRNQRDRDDNADQLRLFSANGVLAVNGMTFTSWAGAEVTVFTNGQFQYDPTHIDVSSYQSGQRFFDGFAYEITDDFAGSSMAMARFEITVADPDNDPFWLDDVRLLNDTSATGGTDHDLRSEDPRITGQVAGNLANATRFVFDFDIDADGSGGGLQPSADLTVNASLTLPVTDPSFPTFQFDPSAVSGFGTYGPKTIAYRARSLDAANGVVAIGVWEYFAFEWLQPRNGGPIRIDDMRLFHDTSIIDDEGQIVGHDDGVTTDPRVRGIVSGDFTTPPLVGDDFREVRVAFEHQRNGTIFGDTITVSSVDTILYDPRQVDPDLASDFSGALAIHYRAELVERRSGTTTTTLLETGTVEFVLMSVPPGCGVAMPQEAPSPVGGYLGSSRDIVGQAVWNSACPPTGLLTYVEFDYASASGAFDEIVDAEIGVTVDGGAQPPSAPITHTAVGLPGIAPQLRARVREWSSTHGAFLYGNWSAPLQLSSATSPGIAEIEVEYETIQQRQIPQVRGFLVGSIDDNFSGVPYHLGAVGFVDLQFYHRHPSDWQFSTSWPVDFASMTDEFGRFSYIPSGLVLDQDYRVWARTVRTLSDGSQVHGDPMYVVDLVRMEGPRFPLITNWGLFNPSVATNVNNRWRTSDTRLAGTLEQQIAGVSVHEIQMEFAHDNLSVNGDEEIVAGITSVAIDGTFVYAPLLATGDVNIRTRMSYFDDITGTRIQTAWHPSEIPLQVVAAVNEPSQIENLQLAYPTNGTAIPPRTFDPTIVGRVANPDGYTGFVTVEFRNADTLALLGSAQSDMMGTFEFRLPDLSPGSYRIDARAEDWDYANQQLVYGPWTMGADSLDFIYEVPAAWEVGSFGLLSDTGPTSGYTANSALFGTIIGGESPSEVQVAIDHGDDGTFESLVRSDANGEFVYFPVALPNGLHSYRASVATWDGTLNAYQYSAGRLTSFVLENQPNLPAQFGTIGLVSPAIGGAPVRDATIAGQVTNERYLDGIAIEFDYDDNDLNGVDETVTTDALGRFCLIPSLLPTGPATIRARTRELDDTGTQYLVSDWHYLPAFDFQPSDNLPPTLTISLVNSSGGTPPVTPDGLVRGTVVNQEPLSQIAIEFSWSENGPIFGTTSVNALGNYQFEPAGLVDGETYTIWARAREPLAAPGASFQYSTAASLTFLFQRNVPGDLHVASLGLVHDTATPGGSTNSDGSTRDATLGGLIAWSTGNVAGLTVEFDVDRDFQPDASVATDSSGAFVFPFQPTEPGFYSVVARVRYPSFGSSDWKHANLVYDIDDSSPQALALVRALAVIDPHWQTADNLDFAAIDDLARTVFAIGSLHAQSDYEYTIALAEVMRMAIVQSVHHEYRQVEAAAQFALLQAVQMAQQEFLINLMSLPVEQRPTYNLSDFVWPTAPFGQSLIVPSDASQPAPPLVPTYDGPSFQPHFDGGFRQAEWNIQQQFLMATRDAELTYVQQRRIVDDQAMADKQAARERFRQAIRQASDTFDTDRENNPQLEETEYQATVDQITDLWRNYQSQWETAYDTWHDQSQALEIQRDQAASNAYDDYLNATENCPAPSPTISQYNACANRIYNATLDLQAKTRQLEAKYRRAMANVNYDYQHTMAITWKEARTASIELERELARIYREHSHDVLIDRQDDLSRFIAAQAEAVAELAEDLATAGSTRDKGFADLLYQRDEQTASVRKGRDQALAAATLFAVQQWSLIVGTPWSLFQSQVASHQNDYQQTVAELAFARDVELAAAVRQEAHSTADATRVRAEEQADEDLLRTVELDRLGADYRIDVDTEYMEQESAIRGDWATFENDRISALTTLRVTSAENWQTLAIATADAHEDNQQPPDLYHARCSSTQGCGVWEYFIAIDNSEVRARNYRTLVRKLAEAERDRAIADADANEDYQNVCIDAMATYRTATNSQVKNTTHAVVDLRFNYEIDIAIEQDRYSLAIATAAAEYSITVGDTEATRALREILAAESYTTEVLPAKRTLDLAAATTTQAFQLSLANLYFNAVISWAAWQSEPWGALHVQRASAELTRVANVQETTVARAVYGSNITIARLTSDSNARRTFAEAIFGSEGAYRVRVMKISQATKELAEGKQLEDFVRRQATAIRHHDGGVADETLEYRLAVVQAEADRDRQLNEAFAERQRDLARIAYTMVVDGSGTNENELRNEAYLQYLRVAARANRQLIIARESARYQWRINVNDLNVLQVRDIVAAQVARAQSIRDESVIMAEAAGDASQEYVDAEATASRQRQMTSADAEATETVRGAELAALSASELVSADGQFQVSVTIARANYEIALFDNHRLATATYSQITATPHAQYIAAVAHADHQRQLALGNAQVLHHQGLAQLASIRQAAANSADLTYADNTAAANRTLATSQSLADRNIANALAGQMAVLHVAKEVAKGELTIAQTEAQGNADIEYAEAAGARNKSYARAELDFVLTITPARADLEVACGYYWLAWSLGCSEATSTYQQIYSDATATQDDANEEADDTFDEAVREIGSREVVELGEARDNYVTALAEARLNYTQVQAERMNHYAVVSAQARNRYSQSVASASYIKEYQLGGMEYQSATSLANLKVANEQHKASAHSAHAMARAQADANYVVAVAANEAAEWHVLAAATPNDLYLQFQAARSTSWSVWTAIMQPHFVTYHSTLQIAHSSAQVQLAVRRAVHSSDLALAEWHHRDQSALLTRDYATMTALIDSHDSVHTVGNQQSLIVGIAEAEGVHALSRASAENTYRIALEQIQQRYNEDHDDQELLRSQREAIYQKAVSHAKADHAWRQTIAGLELLFGRNDANRMFSNTVAYAMADQQFTIEQVAADRIRQLSIASLNATWWRAESDAGQLRSSLALAHANFLTATYSAAVSAMNELANVLSLPWAAFQQDRAIARQTAWANSRSPFITLQQEISQAEEEFTSLRTTAYVSAVQGRLAVDESYSVQRAMTITQSSVAAANVQQDIARHLALETYRYRRQLADVERVYTIAVAEAHRDNTSTTTADQQYTAGILATQQAYRARNRPWYRQRRELLGQLGVDLVTTTESMDVQRAMQHIHIESIFGTELAANYFSPTGSTSLEARLASLYQNYIGHEGSALTSAMASIASSPWSVLALAEATAQQNLVTTPLAQLLYDHRGVLAAAQNDYQSAVILASLTQFQQTTQLGSLTNTLLAASQFALVATFQDGEFALPKNVAVPTPDLGNVVRLTAAISTSFPQVPDIDEYGHPGTYQYWGSNYWGFGNYLDVYWHWSLYGYYHYGWGYWNYAWNYGYGPTYWSGNWGGYYGYWTYQPWMFSWYGWSGGYVQPPQGLGKDYSVNSGQVNAAVGESLSTMLDPTWQASTDLAIAEDTGSPIIQTADGTLTLVNGSATFVSADAMDSRAENQFSDLIDTRLTGEMPDQLDRLATVTRSVIETDGKPRAVSNTPYDFRTRFTMSTVGNAVYVHEMTIPSDITWWEYLAGNGNPLVQKRSHVVGFIGPDEWIAFSGTVEHGRAQLSALTKATQQWNSNRMEQVLAKAQEYGIALSSSTPQIRQLVDGIRSPFVLNSLSNKLGIFIGGTDMHFYGVGNVEKMYNMYRGSKFYYGGVGNQVDSRRPLRESATASHEFDAIIQRAMHDVLKHGAGKQIQIFGWSRGAAQAAELARRLGDIGWPVEFVGLYDPVYSVGKAGQESKYVESTRSSSDGNYVKRKLARTIGSAAIIYAMNEVRTWFPATIFEKEEGAQTNITRIGSPGAHAEIGGHWGSNLWVQQLNLHHMIAMVPGNSTLFDHKIQGKIPEVAALYQSSYTWFLMSGGEDEDEGISLMLRRLRKSLKLASWQNLSSSEFVQQANSRDELHWEPGALVTQANTPVSNWTEVNALAMVETAKNAAVAPIARVRNVLKGESSEGAYDLVQPIYDYWYRQIVPYMNRGHWNLYPGIDSSFLRELYNREINPSDGGWKW